MIAAVIAAALVVAGLIGLATTLAVWLRWAYQENGELRGDVLTEQRRGDDLIDQRDAATVEVKRLEVEGVELRRRLLAAEKQRDELVAQEVRNALQRVSESSDPMDAARLVRELLEADLPGAAKADPAAPGGDQG